METNEADRTLSEVGDMLAEALNGIRFSAGNSETRIISGFPFTVVGAKEDGEVGKRGVEEVAPPFKRFWYYQATGNGTEVFFVPLDPATKIGGKRCYSVPPPSIFVPTGSERVFFVEQSFVVTTFQHCEIVENPQSQQPPPRNNASKAIETITPGQAKIVAFSVGGLPNGTYPDLAADACGYMEDFYGTPYTKRYFMHDAGSYLIYTPLLWLGWSSGGELKELGYHLNAIPPDKRDDWFAVNSYWAGFGWLDGFAYWAGGDPITGYLGFPRGAVHDASGRATESADAAPPP